MFKVAWRKEYVFEIPENHKFPMEKYDLLPKQLIHEGTLTADHFFVPEQIDEKHYKSVHDPDYLSRLFNLQLSAREQRVTGFVHNRALIEREKYIMEGTRMACEFALQNRFAANIAGGTHHAFTNRGEGFCLLNDLAIAAHYVLHRDRNHRVLIVDLDVHQGNGTAEIFRDNPDVFTFSMHGQDNYPLHKEQSDLDLGLPFRCDDQTYLRHLDAGFSKILAKFHPTFVLYQSGVDILASDKLGKLDVTFHGLRQREKIVLDFVKGLQVPMVAAMGGGYSPDIKTIIEAHAELFRQIQVNFF